MKKKILSFVFAICLIVPCMFMLSACGGKVDDMYNDVFVGTGWDKEKIAWVEICAANGTDEMYGSEILHIGEGQSYFKKDVDYVVKVILEGNYYFDTNEIKINIKSKTKDMELTLLRVEGEEKTYVTQPIKAFEEDITLNLLTEPKAVE